MKTLFFITASVLIGVPNGSAGARVQGYGDPTEQLRQTWWNQAEVTMEGTDFNLVHESPSGLGSDDYEHNMAVLWDLARDGQSEITTKSIQTFIHKGGFYPKYDLFSRRLYDQFFRVYIDKIDATDDGKITFEEFENTIVALAKIDAKTSVGLYDEDKDGKITREQQKEMIRAGGVVMMQSMPKYIADKINARLVEEGIFTTFFGEHNGYGYLTANEVAMFNIALYRIAAKLYDNVVESTGHEYKLLEHRHCVPMRKSSENSYTSKSSALLDCGENKKCAMINHPGCYRPPGMEPEFQLCTGIFRDLRGNKRQQPLPSPKGCVLLKAEMPENFYHF